MAMNEWKKKCSVCRGHNLANALYIYIWLEKSACIFGLLVFIRDKIISVGKSIVFVCSHRRLLLLFRFSLTCLRKTEKIENGKEFRNRIRNGGSNTVR